MLTYAIILALALAGYLQAPGWLVLAGAGCLTLDGWRMWRLGPQSRIDWTSKTTTYFITGVAANLILATLAFGGGRMLRVLLGQ
jgi:threonine/homoserine/homoserine lactone efflux protein